MILQAIASKYRARGPLGFASDLGELAIACGVIGVYELVLAAGCVSLVVSVPAAVVIDKALSVVGELSEFRES